MIPRVSGAGLTHQLGPWAFSFGALGGRGGWHLGGSPHSRVGRCSGGPAGHCPGLRAALRLPAGEPGPGKDRGSGPRAGQRPLCTGDVCPHETCSSPKPGVGDHQPLAGMFPLPLPSSPSCVRRDLGPGGQAGCHGDTFRLPGLFFWSGHHCEESPVVTPNPCPGFPQRRD